MLNVLILGLTLNKFTIVQANMERQLELFDILNKSKNEVKMS
jgi:hypothetical protein